MQNHSRSGSGPSERSDRALVLAAREGEKLAFVEIVARHQGLVAGVALAILRDFAASEDAAQESFLTAWKKLGDLRDPDKLTSWLASIARTTALMHLRKRKPEQGIDTLPEAEADDFSPAESAASREESALVLAALEEMPETYRLPLILFYREDNSVRAVAKALDLSEDAVKQRLSRGREMLRERVAGVIDTVLTRTVPSTIFTMTIAAAIGALGSPAAIAASAFSGVALTATTTSSTATTSAATTASAPVTQAATTAPAVAATTATTMSISKLSLTAAAIAAVCIPVGYTARQSTDPGTRDARASVLVASQAGRSDELTAEVPLPDSALVAEWKRLFEEYGSDPESLIRLHGVLEKIDDPFRKRAFLSALIAEWVEADPAGGIEFFRNRKGMNWQRGLFIKEWIKRDPAGAIAGLKAGGKGWAQLIRPELTTLARRAPHLVPALVEELPKSRNSWDTRVKEAFEIIAANNLARARSAAEGVDGPNRLQALSGVATAWAEKNGEEAFAWAKLQEDGEARHEVMRAALLGWAKTDVEAALDRVGLVPAGGEDMHFSSSTGARVLAVAGAADFEATVAWLRDHPEKLGDSDLIGLSSAIQPLLTADPVGFLERHNAAGTLAPLMNGVRSVLLNSGASARLELWEWLQNEPRSASTDDLRSTVLGGLGWQEPRTAMRLVSEMPEGDERTQAHATTAGRIINGGHNLRILDALLDGASPEWRAALIRTGFQQLQSDAVSDPEKWIGRLGELESVERAGAVRSLARTWSERDPESSAEWVATLENAEERRAGIAAVSSVWARKDSYGAGEWVGAFPEGVERDHAAVGLVGVIAESAPDEAWEWVESIGSEDLQLNAAELVVRAMADSDREIAREWIDESEFGEGEKNKLREINQGSGR